MKRRILFWALFLVLLISLCGCMTLRPADDEVRSRTTEGIRDVDLYGSFPEADFHEEDRILHPDKDADIAGESAEALEKIRNDALSVQVGDVVAVMDGDTGDVYDTVIRADFNDFFHSLDFSREYSGCRFNPMSEVLERYNRSHNPDWLLVYELPDDTCLVGEIVFQKCEDCGKLMAHLIDSCENVDEEAHIHHVSKIDLESSMPCSCDLCGKQLTSGKVSCSEGWDGFSYLSMNKENEEDKFFIVHQSFERVFMYVEYLMNAYLENQ